MQEFFHIVIHKVAVIFEPTLIKFVGGALLSLLFFFFGELYTQALIAVLALMVIDTMLGVIASKYEGETITSRRFRHGFAAKAIIYFTAISAAYFADLTIPITVIQTTMIAFVGISEFISILENMGRLGYNTPQKLLNQLRTYRDNK